MLMFPWLFGSSFGAGVNWQVCSMPMRQKPELARDDDVGKLRGDVRTGSIADDPQSFVSNHGYIAEGVRAALVDHVG